MGTFLASFWYSYRNSEQIAFRFLYSLGVIPCDSLKTLLKFRIIPKPHAMDISVMFILPERIFSTAEETFSILRYRVRLFCKRDESVFENGD